jgi:hypothetical protein
LNSKLEADYTGTLYNDYPLWEKIGYYVLPNNVFTQLDIGPGKIRIDLAIDMVNRYLAANSDNDVLSFKKYQGHYDQLFYDLYDDPSLTVKLAALVIKDGQDYFTGKGVPTYFNGTDITYDHQRYSSAIEQWNAYTPEQRSALLVKYYAVGPKALTAEGRDKGFLSYDLDTHGSNITLFQSNLDELRQALKKRGRYPLFSTPELRYQLI